MIHLLIHPTAWKGWSASYRSSSILDSYLPTLPNIPFLLQSCHGRSSVQGRISLPLLPSLPLRRRAGHDGRGPGRCERRGAVRSANVIVPDSVGRLILLGALMGLCLMARGICARRFQEDQRETRVTWGESKCAGPEHQRNHLVYRSWKSSWVQTTCRPAGQQVLIPFCICRVPGTLQDHSQEGDRRGAGAQVACFQMLSVRARPFFSCDFFTLTSDLLL